MTKPKKRRVRGFAPTDAELEHMHGLGYVTPAEAAAIVGLSRSAVYGYARSKKLVSTDPERPATRKRIGQLWILRAAIEELVALPGAAS